MCDRFDRAENSNDRRRVAHPSPRLHTSNPRGGRIRYVRQRKQDTWRVSGTVAAALPASRQNYDPVRFAPRPWLHNNEEDSGNCFYVSGITEGATIVREAAYLFQVPRRWRWAKGCAENCTGGRERGWGARVAQVRVCVSTWGSASGHYASLGNLANDSIETGGMSSMWT